MNDGRSVPDGLAGAEAPEPHSGLGPTGGIPSAEPLNPDAYAFMVLQDEYREQMDIHAHWREEERGLLTRLDHARARALTAADRATSIMETLLKLGCPRDSDGTATAGETQSGLTEGESATAESGDAHD